jgi:hypothetical protein
VPHRPASGSVPYLSSPTPHARARPPTHPPSHPSPGKTEEKATQDIQKRGARRVRAHMGSRSLAAFTFECAETDLLVAVSVSFGRVVSSYSFGVCRFLLCYTHPWGVSRRSCVLLHHMVRNYITTTGPPCEFCEEPGLIILFAAWSLHYIAILGATVLSPPNKEQCCMHTLLSCN